MTPTAKLKRDRLKKLQPRAWIGYLVGYRSSNIYRVWIPGAQNKVISTRDVTFNEDQLFDGNLQTLCDDIREVDPAWLGQAINSALSDVDDLPETNAEDLIEPEAEDQDVFSHLDDIS